MNNDDNIEEQSWMLWHNYPFVVESSETGEDEFWQLFEEIKEESNENRRVCDLQQHLVMAPFELTTMLTISPEEQIIYKKKHLRVFLKTLGAILFVTIILIWLCFSALLSGLGIIIITWLLVALLVSVPFFEKYKARLENADICLKIQREYLFVNNKNIKQYKILLRTVNKVTFDRQHLSLFYQKQPQSKILKIPVTIDYFDKLKEYLEAVAENNFKRQK